MFLKMCEKYAVICTLILLFMAFAAAPKAQATQEITIFYNGSQQYYQPSPQIINERVLVPMRDVFEALGAEVDWNEETHTVIAHKDGGYVSVRVGAYTGIKAEATLQDGKYVLNNTQEIKLDAAPVLVNNYTMVPLRFVSESLGAGVTWQGNISRVDIRTGNYNPKDSETTGPVITGPIISNPDVSTDTGSVWDNWVDPSLGTWTDSTSPTLNTPEEMRGVWISYIDLTGLKLQNIDAMLDKAKAMNLNTVFVHARSFSDSFYKSDLFPWSHTLTGTQGVAPAVDPLQYIIDGAHQRGLRVEAWLNPYRISTSSSLTNNLAANNPAVKWLNDPDKVIRYTSGKENCLIYNPASQEVRDLITDGILEIMRNYDVDGIHFDDYFYVTGTGGGLDESTKKQAVNKLVQQVYSAIKAEDPNMVFGISPAGNIANCNAAGADVQTWLSQSGYVDYVCPQIYWSNQYSNPRFQYNNCLNDWLALKTNPNVDLYIGLALYRVGTTSSVDSGWRTGNTMVTQVQKLRESGSCSGFVLFAVSNLLEEDKQNELAKLRAILN